MRQKNNYPTFPNPGNIGSGLGYQTPPEEVMQLAQNTPETYPAIEEGTPQSEIDAVPAVEMSPWGWVKSGETPDGRAYDIQVQRNVPLPGGRYGTSIQQKYR